MKKTNYYYYPDYHKQWREDNKERLKSLHHEYYLANKDKWAKDNIRNKEKRKTENPERFIWKRTQDTARRKGIEFSISEKDIELPVFCPVLGLKLQFNSKLQNNSYSVDRIDNTKGYIPGNVRVISFRANSLKKDSTINELQKVIMYMKSPFEKEYPDE